LKAGNHNSCSEKDSFKNLCRPGNKPSFESILLRVDLATLLTSV
jgi:hypothetical protein